MRVVSYEETWTTRSRKGGWDKKILSSWGVKWPPLTGWRDRLALGLDPNLPTPAEFAAAIGVIRDTKSDSDISHIPVKKRHGVVRKHRYYSVKRQDWIEEDRLSMWRLYRLKSAIAEL